MYGWRGKIGLLIPATNNIMEPEFNQMAPEGVSVHSARIATDRAATIETLIAMENESKSAGRLVGQAEVQVVVYGCTSGSFVQGPQWNDKICEELTEITGAPTVTTAGAMVASLLHRKVKKVSMVTPYVQVTNERLVNFLKYYDIEVVSLDTFDMLDQYDHASIRPEQIYQLVKRSHKRSADACFIACTQLRALEVVQKLEDDLQMPVMSATQATLWKAFEHLGVRPRFEGYGSLLAELAQSNLLR
jgi:maleate cis-trans isomerase